ncbi:hypothetical protein HKX48_006058 [Thoreauomyces humboldtii]|nr:hypothetical protein HKX48_006058 [Thoreauomyces humboldtii]
MSHQMAILVNKQRETDRRVAKLEEAWLTWRDARERELLALFAAVEEAGVTLPQSVSGPLRSALAAGPPIRDRHPSAPVSSSEKVKSVAAFRAACRGKGSVVGA